MSKLETPLTRAYWRKVGGTLVEEFLMVKAGKNQGRRCLDGLIILGGVHEIASPNDVCIEGRDVICIQTKAKRLGMYLMGQALFSKLLIEKYFSPRSIRSVALCEKTDEVLEPMLREFGIEVVVIAL